MSAIVKKWFSTGRVRAGTFSVEKSKHILKEIEAGEWARAQAHSSDSISLNRICIYIYINYTCHFLQNSPHANPPCTKPPFNNIR